MSTCAHGLTVHCQDCAAELSTLRDRLDEAVMERDDFRRRLAIETATLDHWKALAGSEAGRADLERAAREQAEAALRDIRELGGLGTAGQIARRYFEGLATPNTTKPTEST